MPLKLTNFEPKNIGTLNLWAQQQENMVQSHESQLNNISIFLDRLFKNNPTLVKPNSK